MSKMQTCVHSDLFHSVYSMNAPLHIARTLSHISAENILLKLIFFFFYCSPSCIVVSLDLKTQARLKSLWWRLWGPPIMPPLSPATVMVVVVVPLLPKASFLDGDSASSGLLLRPHGVLLLIQEGSFSSLPPCKSTFFLKCQPACITYIFITMLFTFFALKN